MVVRPENAVSYCRVTANDYRGKNYIGNLNYLDTVKASFRYGSDSWTEVFEGNVEEVGPSLTSQQQVVEALAYGLGRCLRNTHCNTSYGRESLKPTIDTPAEIWTDLRDNYVQKSFGGANTGYSLGLNYGGGTTPVIQFLGGKLRSCLAILNETLQLITASQAGSASHHWFVDSAGTLFIKAINATQGAWAQWWRTDQAGSTLTEGEDLLNYSFKKRVRDFANKIVLHSDFRKPGYDYWTEDSGGQALWGRWGLTGLTDSVAQYVVGSHSLRMESNGAAPGYCWFASSSLAGDAAAGQKNVEVTTPTHFRVGDSVRLWEDTPLSENATIASIAGTTLTMQDNLANAYDVADNAHCSLNLGWDITKIGSEESVPALNFYFHANADTATATTYVRMFTTDPLNDYYYATFIGGDDTATWFHRSIPIGPYWKSDEYQKQYRWSSAGAGNPDWSNINGICFYTFNAAPGNAVIYFDDLHLSGKVIREAYNSWSIAGNVGPPAVTAKKEHQKIVKMDIAVDDSGKQADDSGTAARIAYAELLTALAKPTVGVIVTPGAIDALPGQKVHVHADKQADGTTFRVDMDMRAKQVTHNFNANGFTTTWDLTSDVTNSFAVGYSNVLATLANVIYVDPQAKNLKATGLDTLIQHLAVDYQSDDD